MLKKNKFKMFLLACLLCVVSFSVGSAITKYKLIKVYPVRQGAVVVNRQITNSPIFLYNNRTYVSLPEFCELTGIECNYDSYSKSTIVGVGLVRNPSPPTEQNNLPPAPNQ